MERNVCGVDRFVRLTVGTALALLVVSSVRGRTPEEQPDPLAGWQILAAYAAGELLVTGFLQWCPGNRLLGINTCEADWLTELRDARSRVRR